MEAFWRLCWGPLEIRWEPSGGVGTEDFRGPKMGIPFEREAYFQEPVLAREREARLL